MTSMEQCQLAISAAYTYLFHAKENLIVPRDRRRPDVSLEQLTLLEIQCDSAHLTRNLCELLKLARGGCYTLAFLRHYHPRESGPAHNRIDSPPKPNRLD